MLIMAYLMFAVIFLELKLQQTSDESNISERWQSRFK